MSRPHHLLTALVMTTLLLAPAAGALFWPVNWVTPLPEGSIPTAGETPPQFVVFDEAVTGFMEERGIMSASLAVAVDGKEVYRQGYGWMRATAEDQSLVVRPDSLFRLASITKPHTNVVVRHLADQGDLSLGDRVFCVTGTSGPCHLTIEPYNGVLGDGRLKDITVQHLIDHRGGWDRSASGDPMFDSSRIASTLGVPSPPATDEIVSYMLAQPLDFTPGQGYAYSNLGYATLGLVVEEVSGHDWVDMINHVIHGVPLDADDEDGADLEQGYTLTHEGNDREPFYHCPGLARHVFDPFRQAGVRTCWSDGGWALEPIGAAGSLIASAPTVLDFGTRYWIWGAERDGSCATCWGAFFGSLDGTLTLLEQRTDDLDFVILMNKRWDPEHGTHYDIRETLNEAADAYMGASIHQSAGAGDAVAIAPPLHSEDGLLYHRDGRASGSAS